MATVKGTYYSEKDSKGETGCWIIPRKATKHLITGVFDTSPYGSAAEHSRAFLDSQRQFPLNEIESVELCEKDNPGLLTAILIRMKDGSAQILNTNKEKTASEAANQLATLIGGTLKTGKVIPPAPGFKTAARKQKSSPARKKASALSIFGALLECIGLMLPIGMFSSATYNSSGTDWSGAGFMVLASIAFIILGIWMIRKSKRMINTIYPE